MPKASCDCRTGRHDQGFLHLALDYAEPSEESEKVHITTILVVKKKLLAHQQYLRSVFKRRKLKKCDKAL